MTNLERFKSAKQYISEVHNMEPYWEIDPYYYDDSESKDLMAEYKIGDNIFNLEVLNAEIWCYINDNYSQFDAEEDQDMSYQRLSECVKIFRDMK